MAASEEGEAEPEKASEEEEKRRRHISFAAQESIGTIHKPRGHKIVLKI